MNIDPKPKLSKAAIESNIVYYSALSANAALEYRTALEQETYWMRELEALTKAQSPLVKN